MIAFACIVDQERNGSDRKGFPDLPWFTPAIQLGFS
jgi:hypothetical protein